MRSTIINREAYLGSKEEKEIYELDEIDINKYRLLGRATGISMGHCVLIGSNHKKDFWHRVYGYQIVQNDKTEKALLEMARKIKPKTASYITVEFYERFADTKHMFIPRRLEIAARPELNNFPLNILFGTACLTDNNKQTFETSEYVPDLETFIAEGDEQKMRYYNSLDSTRCHWAEIVYNTKDHSYVGTKYRGDKNAGMAFGNAWDGFFVHFTMLGVGTGVDV